MLPEKPIRRFRVRLRLTADVGFRFLHGGVLQGLLHRGFRGNLPEAMVPCACESGRVAFEKGDAYVFGITYLGAPDTFADDLAAGLERSAKAPGEGRTLAGNFAVEAIDELVPVDPAEIAAEVAELRRQPEVLLQFVSPLRLKRPEELAAARAAYLNQDCFPVGWFLDRLWRRLRFLYDGEYPKDPPPEVPATARATPGRLEWIDLPFAGSTPERRKTLGGVLGRVSFEGLTADWMPWLVAGRHLHAGMSSHFGFGRYALLPASPPSNDVFQPARSVLERITERRILERALDHVCHASDAAGVDQVSPDLFSLRSDEHLDDLERALRSGNYHPSPLVGFLADKKGGGFRPLAIPTVRDRVAQRAVIELMGPAIDELLEDCSFAYRKGFSRAGAARVIQQSYEEGYRYVLDADIEAFFDNVDWERMFDKLEALFPLEPAVALLRDWVRCPVVLDGRLLERERGLPQGSPIAPLLSNLFLDEFDEEVLGDGFRLVRFADDFVVLCKSLEEAERSKAVVARALADLNLKLHERKTGIVSLENGLNYLGYLFCRSVVLDQKPAVEGDPAIDSPPAELPELPRAAWLAQVPLRDLKKLVVDRERKKGRPPPAEVVPLRGMPTRRRHAERPFYVLSPDYRIRLDHETLVAERVAPDGPSEDGVPAETSAAQTTDTEPTDAETTDTQSTATESTRTTGSAETTETRQRVPVHSLSHLVIAGRSRATMPALLRLARAGIPTYLCDDRGELDAVLRPHEPDWRLWLAQARAAADPATQISFAREVVAAKLHNAATLAMRFDWDERMAIAAELRDLERRCFSKQSLDEIRGLEGRGSRRFFEALSANLPPGWSFDKRQRRPPTDPVNALLSFGYTLLFHHLSTAVQEAGLHPQIGVFHQSRGRFDALASDLQEELRHLVDALVWALIRRRQVQPGDFEKQGAGVVMSYDCRRLVINALEQRLLTKFRPGPADDQASGDDQKVTYREFMYDQACQVRALVLGHVDVYRPLRLHA